MCLDYGDDHARLRVIKLPRVTYTHTRPQRVHGEAGVSPVGCISADFLVLLLYYSCVRHHLMGVDIGLQLCEV